ncbi:MAG: hypothetical protein WBQ60_07455 [Asticcacaulis sp.]
MYRKPLPPQSLKSARRRTACLAAAAWLLSVGTGPLIAQTADDYTLPVVKRYYLVQADARCHVLEPAAGLALKAGYLQARNDALRAGLSMAYLAPWMAKARLAAEQTACDAPALTAEAATAQDGFRRFIAVPHVDFITSRTQWSANRAYSDDVTWRLVQYQNTDKADLAFGLYGTLAHNSFSVMARFADGERPYSARLLVRNTEIVSTGLIEPAPYSITTQMPRGFSDFSAFSFMARQASETQAVLRPVVKTNLAGFSLTGDYHGAPQTEDATRFDFPARAWLAIAKLDPREDMLIEFSLKDGPRYARFEVGDFVTGLTYVALPAPYTNNLVNSAS